MRRKTTKLPWLGLCLVGVCAVVSAQPPSDFKPWPNGSREHRPVIQPTPNSTQPAPLLPENASPLLAPQLATIQSVGVNVLAAKHSEQPDPAVDAMREQLKTVSAELAQALRDVSTAKPGTQTLATAVSPDGAGAAFASTTPITHLVPGPVPNTFVVDPNTPPQTDAAAVPAKAMPTASAYAQKPDAWQNEMAPLKRSLTAARAQVANVADGPDAKAQRRSRLAQQQTQLFDDVQRALDAKDVVQLAALRDRLTPRSVPQERERLQSLADPHHKMPSAPTPTVSTLTKHR